MVWGFNEASVSPRQAERRQGWLRGPSDMRAAAGPVAPEGDAGVVIEPGEQVLDLVAPGVQLGAPFARIGHAPLGRGVESVAVRGESGALCKWRCR